MGPRNRLTRPRTGARRPPARARARRVLHARGVWFALAALGGLFAGLYFGAARSGVLTGPLRVSVAGAERANAAELVARADLAPDATLDDRGRARLRAALRAHPWVRDARIVLLPPGQVLLSVREREPRARVALGDADAHWLVDAEGVLIAPAAARDHALPELRGLSATSAPRWTRAQGESRAAQNTFARAATAASARDAASDAARAEETEYAVASEGLHAAEFDAATASARRSGRASAFDAATEGARDVASDAVTTDARAAGYDALSLAELAALPRAHFDARDFAGRAPPEPLRALLVRSVALLDAVRARALPQPRAVLLGGRAASELPALAFAWDAVALLGDAAAGAASSEHAGHTARAADGERTPLNRLGATGTEHAARAALHRPGAAGDERAAGTALNRLGATGGARSADIEHAASTVRARGATDALNRLGARAGALRGSSAREGALRGSSTRAGVRGLADSGRAGVKLSRERIVLLGDGEASRQLARLVRLQRAGLADFADATLVDLRFGEQVILRAR